MGRKSEGYSAIPADYPVDALALEATRRGRALGRPYSYGQLVADTTREQREELAESYRCELAKAIRRGHRRVSGGTRCVLLQTKKEAFREEERRIKEQPGE